MKASFRITGIAFLLFTGRNAYAQGWQFMGPDSVNWQSVQQISMRWIDQTEYDLAATVLNDNGNPKGITFYSPSLHWTYPLGTSFFYAEFSIWHADSLFLASERRSNLHRLDSIFLRQHHYPSFLYSTNSPPLLALTDVVGREPRIHFGPQSDSIAMFSVAGQLWQSTNRGRTWGPGSPPPNAFYFRLPKQGGSKASVFGSGDLGLPQVRWFLARSTNSGTSWDSLFSGRPLFECVFSTGDTILAGVAGSDTTSFSGIYRSTNGGTTWTTAYATKGIVGVVESHVSINTLFAGSEDGILKSTDFGTTWTMYNNALPTRRLTNLIISPHSDTMFVSTETHGVLKVWSYLTDVHENTPVPSKFKLVQNYPNPFNPSTTFSFSIPYSSFVTLTVYDVLGREVALLVHGEKKQGTYEVMWEATGVASGVYFYKLEATSQSGLFGDIKKLVLLR